MQDAMCALIDALDLMDGDPDLEAEEPEPNIGSSAVRLPDGTLADDVELDDSDCEPSLGWGFHFDAHCAANMRSSDD